MEEWVIYVMNKWNISDWLTLGLFFVTAIYVFYTTRILKTMRDEARKTATARLNDLLWRLQQDYRSAEMLLAIEALWHFYDNNKSNFVEEYMNVCESEYNKIIEMEPEQQATATTGRLHYKRRIVSHFFQSLAVLRDLEAIEDRMLYSHWPERILRIIPVILIPIETKLAEVLKTEASFRETKERLNRLYEGSKSTYN